MVTPSLIERCARQERPAQFELYKALYPLMMSICSRYERNTHDAAARMNQGFLKILQNIGTIKPEVPFAAWASRIMINTVIDDHRRSRERKAMEVYQDAMDDHGGAELNDYVAEMEAEELAGLLQGVPNMSRQVFNLFAIDGFTHAEISSLLNISVGTSKWHVNNARTILRNVLTQRAHTRDPHPGYAPQHVSR